jgi:hypothetical protein
MMKMMKLMKIKTFNQWNSRVFVPWSQFGPIRNCAQVSKVLAILIGLEKCAGRIEPTVLSGNVTARWCAECSSLYILLESWDQIFFRGNIPWSVRSISLIMYS